MKKLLLIRHAKATHDTGFEDFERPLKPGGLQDAATIAARLKENDIVPQVIISSPALRALSTANVMAGHLSLAQPQTEMKIYDASQAALLAVVESLADASDFIALAGHNPGFSELLAYFTEDFRNMDTCAAALITFEANSWKKLSHGTGKLAYYTAP
jgi:phosphohistidine phosphatase